MKKRIEQLTQEIERMLTGVYSAEELPRAQKKLNGLIMSRQALIGVKKTGKKNYSTPIIMTIAEDTRKRNPLDILGRMGMGLEDMIDKVIFNKPATIVKWKDGTKTVVVCQKGKNGARERFDPEKGLALAIVKRIYGNRGCYNELFKKYGE